MLLFFCTKTNFCGCGVSILVHLRLNFFLSGILASIYSLICFLICWLKFNDGGNGVLLKVFDLVNFLSPIIFIKSFIIYSVFLIGSSGELLY
jgi:hypothetical protein